ncbi:MAG: hypothetical protein LIO85_10810 [Rikenellaceae bacterium]|nr:hypothetical protein [Rikenellaceae bacterium]
MKRINIIQIFILTVTAFLAGACNDVKEPSVSSGTTEGALLNLSVSFDCISTRLAELGSAEDMNKSNIDGTEYGLNHIGLYIYYKSDYSANDLTKPYVKNLECEIQDGNRLVPVLEPGQSSDDANIYIYDEMIIVAYYPYNAEIADDAIATQDNEDKYVITNNDYSKQYYIPYKAVRETNPTTCYYTDLYFYPKHTYKVEIVVVSDDESDFVSADDIIILPNIDSKENTDTDLDGKRVKWYDIAREYDKQTGGSYVRQYTAYIWTKERGDNDIPRGEVLLQAGDLTLIASQEVKVQEQYVYRYGYNMSTGEIFIPTSTNLIWNAESLQAFAGGEADGYQVCDIDLDGFSYTPHAITQGRYDGGGHKIENLMINSSDENVGLFSEVTYNAAVSNVNLIAPQITVNSASTVNVGAICGKVNGVLSQALIDSFLAGLPDNLSPVVREAIVAQLLADAFDNDCRIAGCRVEDPVIVVNAPAPRVGTICGTAGDRDDDGDYKALIWSCYSLGGSITVNAGNIDDNTGGYVGAFCGLNNGRIFSSYTTIEDITFQQNVGGTATDAYTGFTTMGDLFTSASDAGLSDDYTLLPDTTAGVLQMPGNWPSWTSQTAWWPIVTTGWIGSETLFWYDSGSPSTYYPILQWERR